MSRQMSGMPRQTGGMPTARTRREPASRGGVGSRELAGCAFRILVRAVWQLTAGPPASSAVMQFPGQQQPHGGRAATAPKGAGVRLVDGTL